jgi:hypothetical protein
MTSYRARRFGAVLLVYLAASISAGAAMPAAKPDAVAAALGKPANLDVAGAPLSEVVTSLATSQRVPIVFDWPMLRSAGIRPQEIAVTAKTKDQSLAAALDDLLRPHKLAWIVRHDVVLVTTVAAAQERYVETRVYRLTRPVAPQRRINTIMSTVAPETWANAGGPGDAVALPPRAMAIRQSPLVHRQILAKFANSLVAVRGRGELAEKAETAKRLAGPIKITFEDAPLADALRRLSEASGLRITLDEASLKEAGIHGDELRITLVIGEAPQLAAGLSLLLEQADPKLAWTEGEDGIVVRSVKAASAQRVRRTYRVGDILPDGELETLMQAIRDTIAPADWEEIGGEGILRAGEKPDTLEVTQSDPVHRELRRLFADLRAAASR